MTALIENKNGIVQKLDQRLAIYVPSTDFETAVSSEIFQERIEDAEYFLSRVFGGCTSINNARGSWVENSYDVITEDIAIVYCWTTNEKLFKHTNQLITFVYENLIHWQQYSVSLEAINALWFIENNSDLTAIEASIILSIADYIEA